MESVFLIYINRASPSINESITESLRIKSHTDVIDIDVYNISRADQWSLIRQGEKLPRDIADQLYRGNPAGDKCLKLIAKILVQCIRRPTDLVAPYGGEEFIWLLPDIDEHDGKEIAAKIMDRVKQPNIPHSKSPFAGMLTVSLGCLIVDSARQCSPDRVISQVDQLLYRAKQSGRNTLI